MLPALHRSCFWYYQICRSGFWFWDLLSFLLGRLKRHHKARPSFGENGCLRSLVSPKADLGSAPEKRVRVRLCYCCCPPDLNSSDLVLICFASASFCPATRFSLLFGVALCCLSSRSLTRTPPGCPSFRLSATDPTICSSHSLRSNRFLSLLRHFSKLPTILFMKSRSTLASTVSCKLGHKTNFFLDFGLPPPWILGSSSCVRELPVDEGYWQESFFINLWLKLFWKWLTYSSELSLICSWQLPSIKFIKMVSSQIPLFDRNSRWRQRK